MEKRAIQAHAARFFPELFAADRRGATAVVERAIRRAASYHFVTFGDVQQFVDLVLELGEDFEFLPEFHWALAILNDLNPARAPFRATCLYERIVRQLAREETHNACG